MKDVQPVEKEISPIRNETIHQKTPISSLMGQNMENSRWKTLKIETQKKWNKAELNSSSRDSEFEPPKRERGKGGGVLEMLLDCRGRDEMKSNETKRNEMSFGRRRRPKETQTACEKASGEAPLPERFHGCCCFFPSLSCGVGVVNDDDDVVDDVGRPWRQTGRRQTSRRRPPTK